MSAFPAFTARTAWDRTPNLLAAALAARRAKGEEVLDLTASNPAACGIPYPDAAIREALAAPGALDYAPHPRGLAAAREAVAAAYAARGAAVGPDRILLTAGTSEAYAFLFRLLCEPGDAVLVPHPGYPLLEFLARVNDVVLRPYPLRWDGRWRIDLEGLRAAAAAGAKAVVVVHPNNPTGNYVTRGEREALADLCGAAGLALIADEVFAEYPFDAGGPPDAVRTFAAENDMLGFTLGGLSKSAGLPGLKLSWTVVSGPRAAREEALARLDLLADTYLSAGTPVQRALPRILELAGAVRDAIAARVRRNRRTLAGAFGARLLAAEGGWYGVIRTSGGASDEDTALRLLRDGGVLLHPGYFYDFPEDGNLVVSLLPPPETFDEGIRRVQAGAPSLRT